ncbi:MAG: LptF/LptG family permease [Saprospiraceae bacterium]|nr:LptF/LptG family permease [Saprospiraceae bacterium]
MRFKFWHIKKIDKLLLEEFIPPFVTAFMIAMFVLMMQFLWLYIDDIAGKGIGLFVLAEMIYYMALSLIPMALPIAILLASVMVYGNLAEKYELPSLKTAGIPLMRVMRSSMIFAALVAFSSFLCSNYVIPYANLKFRSRLYDIKKQKPALYLESGVFNDDFQGTSIRIGKKHSDNRTIEDVMIDDDLKNQRNEFSIIRAEKGEMFVTTDERYFIMKLEDGYQYQKAEVSSIRSKFPFVRTKFGEWSKTFDLGEFDLNRTDENLFKTYHAMLSTKQLAEGIDTIRQRINTMEAELHGDVWQKMAYFDYDPAQDSINLRRVQRQVDKLAGDAGFVKETDTLSTDSTVVGDSVVKISKGKLPLKNKPISNTINDILIPQPHLDSLSYAESILSTFPVEKQIMYVDNARNLIRSSKNIHYEYRQKVKNEIERKQRYVYQLHSKYGFAVVCFIFLFIGAPMGAIVRKGGFGYPLLVAIFFFMLFVILTKLFEKLSRSGTLDALFAAWLPCVILFPLGLFLTVKAMNDSKVLNVDRLVVWINKMINKSSDNQPPPKNDVVQDGV